MDQLQTQFQLGIKKNLNLFKDFYPNFRTKVSEHNVYRHKRPSETEDEYTNRCVDEIKKKIIKIGPDNICAFVAETVMGGLVGDVPPSKNYWKKIRKLCDIYKIHIICDEVWCGAGTTGKNFSIDWDDITPDFVTFGKTLTSGYVPLSVIMTKKEILAEIKSKFKTVLLPSSTYQGHSLGVAAGVASQKIINDNLFHSQTIKKGHYLRKTLNEQLKDIDFFKNVRGRGMRNSFEFHTSNNDLFSYYIRKHSLNTHNLILNARWHRVCFSPAINIKKQEIDIIIGKFIKTYKYVVNNWPSLKKNAKYK